MEKFLKIELPDGKTKKATLNETHGKGSLKGTGFGFLIDILAGATGALAGAFVGGLPSIGLGLVSMFAGHYWNVQPLRPLGLMMFLTSSQSRNNAGMKTMQPWSKGFDPGTELKNGVERVKNLIGNVGEKWSLNSYQAGGGAAQGTENNSTEEGGNLEGFLSGFQDDINQLNALAMDQVTEAVSFAKSAGEFVPEMSQAAISASPVGEFDIENM